MAIRRVIKTRIGELLIQKGLLTPEQLQQALALRKQNKDKRLGEILLELGFVSREQLLLVLAIQFGYPYININHCVVDQEVLSLLPKEMVKNYQVLPIDKIKDVLTVAMVNPLDQLSIINQIEKMTKCSVEIFLTTPQEFAEAFDQYYGTETP